MILHSFLPISDFHVLMLSAQWLVEMGQDGKVVKEEEMTQVRSEIACLASALRTLGNGAIRAGSVMEVRGCLTHRDFAQGTAFPFPPLGPLMRLSPYVAQPVESVAGRGGGGRPRGECQVSSAPSSTRASTPASAPPWPCSPTPCSTPSKAASATSGLTTHR